MTDDSLPYGDNSVNKAIRPLKVVPFRKEHYFCCPSGFMKREDLSAEEKGLVGILLGHLDKEANCWPTHPQLVKMAKMGHCKLERMLKELREKKVITWAHFTDKWGHRRCRYTLIFLRNPTPTNELLATPSKPVGKVLPYTPEHDDRLEEQSEKYGGLL